ncbi:hypothetical protein L6V77_00890 [Myxococcota bacterium]|nr:hypothetical protein [Myxococcota bacterium]
MSFTRGLPTAHCPACAEDQLVWRDPETNAPRCLGCDALLDEAQIGHARAAEVADRHDYVFLDVTQSAEACGCDTCPAHGHCEHTRDDAPETETSP